MKQPPAAAPDEPKSSILIISQTRDCPNDGLAISAGRLDERERERETETTLFRARNAEAVGTSRRLNAQINIGNSSNHGHR